MGFDKEKLITDPMCSALGYGLEYTYSVMERIRLAGLFQNDATMQPPILGDVGMYVWKVKETVASVSDVPEWGQLEERGITWEAMTATAMIISGTNLLIMRHPKAIEIVNKTIEELI
jgi:acetyl-CoA decarbonylase/synthase complex subunit delta